jgi:hypothetical protein
MASTESATVSAVLAVTTSRRGRLRRSSPTEFLLPRLLGEAVLAHPQRVQELRHVVAHGVREDDREALARADALRHLDRGPDRRSRRAAAQKAFLADQLARGEEGFAVLGLHPFVDERRVAHLRNEVVADALDLVRADGAGAGDDRAHRIDSDDLDAGDVALEAIRDAGQRAAGARGEDDVIELAAGLLDDLRAGALEVRRRIGGVVVLIEDVRVREDLLELLRDADVAVGRIVGGFGGGADDLRAERFEHHLLLATHLLRHRDDHPVAADRGDERHADARVPARGLDQRVARPDAARALGVEHHLLPDPVLHGAAGVQEFALAEELAAGLLADCLEPDERRIADRVEDRITDLEHGGIPKKPRGEPRLRAARRSRSGEF